MSEKRSKRDSEMAESIGRTSPMQQKQGANRDNYASNDTVNTKKALMDVIKNSSTHGLGQSFAIE